MKRLVIAIIFFFVLSTTFAFAHHRTGFHGTRVHIVYQYAQWNVVCLIFRDGQPAVIKKHGQDMTMWLTKGEPDYSVVGGQMTANEPEYGSFVLQLTCYQGTEHELRSGHAARVMQRPVCNTAPIRYEYGPYTDHYEYRFGSPNSPCSMER